MLESRLFRHLRDGWLRLTLGFYADEEAKATRHWLKQTKTNRTQQTDSSFRTTLPVTEFESQLSHQFQWPQASRRSATPSFLQSLPQQLVREVVGEEPCQLSPQN